MSYVAPVDAWVSWGSRRRLGGAVDEWPTPFTDPYLRGMCRDDGALCGAVDMECSRPVGHPGRHMAALDGAVIGAWPGTHPPDVRFDLGDQEAGQVTEVDAVHEAWRAGHVARGTRVEIEFPPVAPFDVVWEFLDRVTDDAYGLDRDGWDPFVSSCRSTAFVSGDTGEVKGASEGSTREELWADLEATRGHYEALVARMNRVRVALGVPADAGPDKAEEAATVLAANQPRTVSTAADLRALGEAVRDGDPGAAPNGIPAVTLVEEPNGRPWQMAAVVSDGECEVFMAPMQEIWERQTVVPFWATDRVTDDGISGHGPWRVVWHRGVDLP